jgi:hypothetical protein
MENEELVKQIEDDKFGLYTVDGKWLFESWSNGKPNGRSIFYLMNPNKIDPNREMYFTIGIDVPDGSTDQFILDKVSIAKKDYYKYCHEVDLDGGDLGTANL